VLGLTPLALGGLIVFLRRNEALLAERRLHAIELRLERDRLDVEVAHRTADLTELARHLQTVRARTNAPTWPASCTTSWARCSPPPSWTWPACVAPPAPACPRSTSGCST
jgi:hypothetical protein